MDVFAGQPYLTPNYMMDRGVGYQQSLTDEDDFTGWRNERIVPELSDRIILEHLQKVQRTGQIKPAEHLEGHYNPDWAIAFYEGTVKHIYFVAETKGSMSSMQLREIEKSKIYCAREHFKAISGENVVYDVVDSYETLLNKVMK